TDSNYQNVWDFANNTVESDLTLYAGWRIVNSGSGGGGHRGGSSLPAITVTPQPEKNNNKNDSNDDRQNTSFNDIENHWAKDSIENLYKEGIISGEDNYTFNPDKTITRAEFTAMIYSLLKLPEEKTNNFSDVADGDWFNTAVSAVAKTGIISGYDGNFRPNDNISRQEMAVVASKLYDYLGMKCKEEYQISDFTDSADIAEWAAPYVSKMVGAKIINGYDDGSFRPNSDTSRAHAVVVIDMIIKQK
ncbi:MAG: S-layer homology domain-containing protein, partial [Clostridiales bacterium]|nr:S-layer homology domain-containing protein [Clostridiales bacterium]